MDNSESILKKRHEDCLPCRLISGFGVIGMGIYIYAQSKHRPKSLSKNIIQLLAAGTGFIGAARLLGVYPFNK